jgi:hypothetical protein
MVVFDYSAAARASSAAAITYSAANILKGGLPPRDPDEEKAQAALVFMDAMKEGVWGFAPAFEGLFAPREYVETMDSFDDMTAEVRDEFDENINTALLAAIASEGPITDRKFWIKLSASKHFKTADADAEPYNIFFTLPQLAVMGVHQKILIHHAEQIHRYLRDGGRSYINSYLESKNVTFRKDSNKFLTFPKSHYCRAFPYSTENYELMKADFASIFEGMSNNPKGKGPAPVLKFF